MDPTAKGFPLWYPIQKDFGKKVKKTCNNLGIQVHFKGNSTIQTILMTPKDKENKCQKVGLYTGSSTHTVNAWKNT